MLDTRVLGGVDRVSLIQCPMELNVLMPIEISLSINCFLINVKISYFSPE